MPRSDEAAAFFAAVYSAVQEIPPGKVTSYGHIAKLIGTRKDPKTYPWLSTGSLLNFTTSTKTSPSRRLPEAPHPRHRCILQPHQRALAAGDQLQGDHLTTVTTRVFKTLLCGDPQGGGWWLLTKGSRSQHPSATRSQADALRAEGVTVIVGPLGELEVDFAEYGWFPDVLPSEIDEGEDDSGGSETQ